MSNVISFGAAKSERLDDNTLVSPADALRKAADDIESGDIQCNKIVLLMLNAGEGGEEYSTCLRFCNMKTSEMVALLEISKMTVINSMD